MPGWKRLQAWKAHAQGSPASVRMRAAVPTAQLQCAQASTKVKLGATAGLRLLPEGKADVILGEVRRFLRTYPFQLDAELGVTILDGEVFSFARSLPAGCRAGRDHSGR